MRKINSIAIFVAATSALAITTSENLSIKAEENDIGGLKEWNTDMPLEAEFILDEEASFREKIKKKPALARQTRIMIMTGEREETAVTVGDSMALAKRLEELSAYGVRSEFKLLEDEGHMTVPSRSITSALRYVMQQP